MEAGLDAGGDSVTPYSKFVDRSKLASNWKARPASPSTVTNVAVLPLGQTKKNIKTFLRERLFAPNHDIRSVLFKSLAKRIPHNTSMFSEQMYKDFIQECYPKVTTYKNAPLPSFVLEDEDLPSYLLNDQGKLELRKILVCINHHFSHIVYCPILPPIVAILLHYDDSPSQVFAHVCHILFCNARHMHYIDQNKADTEASARVVKELVRRFAPTSHKTLVNFTTNPDDIYSQWLRVIFHGLPFAYLVILFDMYLIEGYKALFRAAIAVLKFYKKVGLSNPSDILSAVFGFVQSIDTKVSTNLLFRKAYSIKLPTTKELRKLHQKQLSVLRQLPIADTSRRSSQERTPWRYIFFVRNVNSDIVDETLFSKLYCWLPERISILRPTLLFSTNKDGYSLEAFFRASDERTPSILLIKTTEGSVLGAYLTADWTERKTDPNAYFGTGETFLFTLSPEYKKYNWVGLRSGGSSISNLQSSNGRNSLCSSVASGMKSLPPDAARSSRGITLPPIRHDGASPSLASVTKDSRESSVVLPPLVISPVSQESIPSFSSSTINESSSRAKIMQKTSNEKMAKTSSDLFMFADSRGIVVGGGNGYGLFMDSSFLNCTTEHCETFENKPLVKGGSFQCSHVELFGFTD
uniref:TBC1 domain family member 24-like n=1 Tax=Styela clava TaxID=7725 RepID=UPI00193A8542|nr:TBC1 domain family member 24-like [Styela clava]